MRTIFTAAAILLGASIVAPQLAHAQTTGVGGAREGAAEAGGATGTLPKDSRAQPALRATPGMEAHPGGTATTNGSPADQSAAGAGGH